MEDKQLKIGDKVLIEQCWEDEAGHYHDEIMTVKKIYPDGRLKFRIGHWKNRKIKEQKIQAWINKQEIYIEDVVKIDNK